MGFLNLKKFPMAPAKLFLAFASFIGICLVIVTPPFQVPDEIVHFYRAFQVSEGKFIPNRLQNGLGGYLPVGLEGVVENSGVAGVPFHREKKVDVNKIIQSLGCTMDISKKSPYVFTASAIYSPLVYLPQAVGISIARIFCVSPLAMFYTGRLFNLLTYIIVVSVAIMITPVQKRSLAVIALMPMALYLAASLSSDVFSTSVIFLFFSVVSYASFSANHMMSWTLVTLLILAISIGQCKGGAYVPLVGTILIIPSSQLASRKNYCLFVGAIVLSSIVSASLWLHIVTDLSGSFLMIEHPFGDPFSSVAANPLDFPRRLYRTFILDGCSFISQFWGVLGWLDVPLPKFIGGAYLIMLLLASVIPSPKTSVRVALFQRLVALSLAICVVIMIGMALFATWPQWKPETISGLQGRYFIPLAPYFLLIFYNRRRYYLAKYYDTALILLIVVTWLTTFASLYYRYYTTNSVSAFWKSLGVYSFGF